MLAISVADPNQGTGACFTPGSTMSKKSTGMNIPDHISESLETIFCLKTYFLTLDPAGIRDGKIRIRNNYPGSATLLPIKSDGRLQIKLGIFLPMGRAGRGTVYITIQIKTELTNLAQRAKRRHRLRTEENFMSRSLSPLRNP